MAFAIAVSTVTLGVCWHTRSHAGGGFATVAHAAGSVGPQLPDAAIFGRPTSEAVRLLREKKVDEAEPMTVHVDVRCGRYSAMTAMYPAEVSEAAAKMAVSSLYGSENITSNGKTLGGMWRVDSQRFSVMVVVEKEGFNRGNVLVMFTHFVGPDPCADFASEPPTR
jgi:hypothetical protein